MSDKKLTAAQLRRVEEQKCMSKDSTNSRQLWTTKFGGIRGWQKCWDATYASEPRITKTADSGELQPLVGKKIDAGIACPNILYQEHQKHNAFSIVQVESVDSVTGHISRGWTVLTYEIDGDSAVITDMTDIEHKNFSAGRIIGAVRGEIRGK